MTSQITCAHCGRITSLVVIGRRRGRNPVPSTFARRSDYGEATSNTTSKPLKNVW